MDPSFQNVDRRNAVAFTFADAATVSDVKDLKGAAIVGVYCPVGVTSGNLSFKASPQVGSGPKIGTETAKIPDLPLVDVYNDAAAPAIITLTGVQAGRSYYFTDANAKALKCLRNVQLVMSVGQAAGGSTIYLILADRNY